MKITSPAFKANEMIPAKYTCEGEDLSPPLQISDVPKETKSLCLIVHDHDAPGGDFVHWLLWNINPEISDIKEGNASSLAMEGVNDSGQMGWKGPCPPSGKHHYEFHLYALDKSLDSPAGVDKTSLRNQIQGHILEEASLVGLYEKF